MAMFYENENTLKWQLYIILKLNCVGNILVFARPKQSGRRPHQHKTCTIFYAVSTVLVIRSQLLT